MTAHTEYIPGFTSYERHDLNVAAAKYNISNDRVYRDELQLIYNENDIIIPTNSIITSDLLNSIANKLFENYMHILSRCKIAKTDAFESYRGYFELSKDTDTQAVTGQYATDPMTNIPNNLLDGDVKSVDIIDTTQPGVYGLIVANSTSVQLYDFIPSYKPYQNGIIIPVSRQQGENLVETNNQLTFSNIQKVLVDNKNNMYVYDSGRHVLYKYNIKGLTRKDAVILNQETRGRQLTELFGGEGAVNSPTQFSDVIDITYDLDADQLYVIDNGAGQFYVKLYDSQLNWLDSFNVSLDFRKNIPIKIKTHQNMMYILTSTGLLYRYDIENLKAGSHDAVEVIDLNVVDFDFVEDEYYVDIVFSSTSANLCYVQTNKTIYKKYLTRLDKIVANISWAKHNILGGELQPMSLTLHNRQNTQDDIMLIIGQASDGENRLLHFVDTENIQELLARNYENQVFLLEDIEIKPNETVSSFVYNKYVYKFLYNNLVILNNLKYVASVEVGYSGDFLYPGIRYISQQEINRLIRSRNKHVYVGVNELVTTGVLNRVLRDVVTDQRLTLQAVIDRENTDEFFDSTVLVLTKHPVPHVKHVISEQPIPDQPPLLGGTHKIDKL